MTGAAGGARLTFLARRGCHLCDVAKEVVERVIPGHHVLLEVVDVDSREELAGRYGEEVPVLLIEGTKAFKFRIEEERLRRKLRRYCRAQS